MSRKRSGCCSKSVRFRSSPWLVDGWRWRCCWGSCRSWILCDFVTKKMKSLVGCCQQFLFLRIRCTSIPRMIQLEFYHPQQQDRCCCYWTKSSSNGDHFAACIMPQNFHSFLWKHSLHLFISLETFPASGGASRSQTVVVVVVVVVEDEESVRKNFDNICSCLMEVDVKRINRVVSSRTTSPAWNDCVT